MGWKYIETTDPETAARHFGIHDPNCPIVRLANGMTAVWTGAPLQEAEQYPALHHAPEEDDVAPFPVIKSARKPRRRAEPKNN